MVGKSTDLAIEIISLYRTDYSKELYVRQIAKKLGKSHVTLLPYLRSLEKKKVLNSRFIGRNKAFSLNLRNIIARNFLLISELKKTNDYIDRVFIIKKIVQELFDFEFRGSLILFGSYADESFDENSDIDLFYFGRIGEETKKEIRKIGEIYGKIINIKMSSMSNFEKGIKKRDALTIEIVKKHIILNNSEQFVNLLWRFYNERRL